LKKGSKWARVSGVVGKRNQQSVYPAVKEGGYVHPFFFQNDSEDWLMMRFITFAIWRRFPMPAITADIK